MQNKSERGFKKCMHEHITRKFRYSCELFKFSQHELFKDWLKHIIDKVECQTDQQMKAVMHVF